jgi:hypothetical protein
MSLLGLTSLVIRLMGIFLLVKTIGNLLIFLGSISSVFGADKLNPAYFAESVSIPILYLLACVMLIVRSDSIASRVVHDTDVNVSLNVDAKTIQNIVFCSIGLIALTNAIPKLAQVLTTYIMSKPFPNDGLINGAYTYSQLVGTFVQIFIGLFLVLGADGMVNLIKKVRLPREVKNI